MSDTKDTTLVKKINRAKVLLVIYGVFGFFFGIYIFIIYIYSLFHTEGLQIILLPLALAFTLSCIFGGLKEFAAAAQLKENVLLGARDGIYGQLMITIPSTFFVLNINALIGIKYLIGPITILIPITWILYNIILFFKLRLGFLKIIAQTKQNLKGK